MGRNRVTFKSYWGSTPRQATGVGVVLNAAP
nr:MAG TPA: hypothetical protein [Caudoviricetes sp.]